MTPPSLKDCKLVIVFLGRKISSLKNLHSGEVVTMKIYFIYRLDACLPAGKN